MLSRMIAIMAVAGTAGQLMGSITLEKVVDTSDAVSGVAGASWALGLNGFQNPSIDLNGNVAFRGNLSGVPTGTTTGYWYGVPGALGLVARQGDATPDNANSGGAGATISAVQTNLTPMSVNGKIWIGATITGGSVVTSGTNADNRIFWTGTPGNLQRHARRWDEMPGTAGARFFSAPDSTSAPQLVNRSGQAWVGGTLAANVGDTGAIGTNDAGMWFGAAGSLQLVGRRQDAAWGLAGGERLQNINLFSFNDAGTLLINSTLRANEAGVTLTNDSVIYKGGVGSQVLVGREGGASGIAGVNFGSSTSTLFPLFTAARVSLNNSNVAVFASAQPLTGPGVTAGVDDAALFVNDASNTNSIFKRKGATTPGIAGTTLNQFAITETLITNNNRIAWQAQIAGAGVTTANDRALWLSSLSGNDILITREGDAAPGIANAFMGEAVNVLANTLNHVVFQSTLTGSGVTTANDRTLWAWTPASGLELIAREGDTLFGTTIASFGVDTSTTGSGSLAALNDNGWLAFKINASGSTASSVVIRTLIPSPAGAALLAMAGVLAARRRR